MLNMSQAEDRKKLKSKAKAEMAMKSSTTTRSKTKSLFLTFTLLSLLTLSLFIIFTSHTSQPTNSLSQNTLLSLQNSIKVYVANLPRALNYGLLEQYWASNHPDSRIPTDPDHQISTTHSSKSTKYPPYPDNPLIKQYSAEYWIMGDLETPQEMRSGSFAKRVFDVNEADVVFVPFFATLSAEMELGSGSGAFKKKAGNGDYLRQKEVLDFVRNTDAWKRSGGWDHVFVLTAVNLKRDSFGFLDACSWMDQLYEAGKEIYISSSVDS